MTKTKMKNQDPKNCFSMTACTGGAGGADRLYGVITTGQRAKVPAEMDLLWYCIERPFFIKACMHHIITNP